MFRFNRTIVLLMVPVALLSCLTLNLAAQASPGAVQRKAEGIEQASASDPRVGVRASDALKGRTAEYDYDVPVPGSYQLPVIRPAAEGRVLGTNGVPVSLHQLMKDRVVVLSFIYTRCGNPKACMAATGVLSQLQRASRLTPELAGKMLLITLSFDPGHDTPEIMSRYGRVSTARDGGAEWVFLTTRNQKELEPLLKAYGQRVDRREEPSPLGPYYHPLRVYLIDPQQRIRNIYSYGLLDPRLVITDVQTLVMEKKN